MNSYSPTQGMADFDENPRQKIPGLSPAYHIGDFQNDILSIENIVLSSWPIDFYLEEALTVTVNGRFSHDLGPQWHLRMTAALDHGEEREEEDNTRRWRPFTMRQDGKDTFDDPQEGEVVMVWTGLPAFPLAWMDEGTHTFRVYLWDSDGRRVIAFVASVWIPGGRDPEGDDKGCVVC